MSTRPIIFVSAVSTELRSSRQLVSNTLQFLGYEPVWQDIFSTEQGDLREMLRRQIDQCKGLIQLVGNCFGAEPPTPDAQFGRVSYTQYEALYAKQQGKKVWYLFLDDGFPADAHDEEPEELRKLQATYRRRLKAESQLFHPLSSKEALESSVLKLRNDLVRLRRGVKQWAATVAVLLVVSVGLSLWLLLGQRESARTMDITAAQATLDRAIQSKDGSIQGQAAAIEALLANGYVYRGADLSGISLAGAHLAGGVFSGARLHLVDFTGVQAQRANFSGSGLRFAKLERGHFEEASLSKSYAPFVWGQKVDFDNADLSDANFFAGDFRGASFRGANLKGASFSFADLREARFDGADLTNAYLIGAVLDGASFSGATIKNTDFNAAAADKIQLTSKQRRGVCRHRSLFKWLVRVMEQWPSNRYSTGLEFDTIVEQQRFLFLAHYEGSALRFDIDESLPLCAAQPKVTTIGFDADYPAEVQLHLDRAYVSKAGRRQIVRERMKDILSFLIANLSKDRVLKGSGRPAPN